MKQRNAIVSGGSSGIGRAICIELAKKNCDIIFTYRNSLEKANSLTNEIEDKYNRRCIPVKCDMTNFDDVKKLGKIIKSEFETVDIVVNNVGTTGDLCLFMMSNIDHWYKILKANLDPVINLTKIVIPIMIRKKNGRIINITSLGGITGNPGYSSYAAAKAAIYSFTKSIQKEVGQFGIIFNCVAPGLINTEMTNAVSDKYQNTRLSNSIIKRMGEPEEVSSLVGYLAVDAPDYLINQEIVIDGGIRV